MSAEIPFSFYYARLLATDFDGTVAKTFEPSPHNIDVNEAYRQSIDEVFGLTALEKYIADGEHQMRAPAEIAQAIAPDIQGAELTETTEKLIQAKLAILENEIGPQPDGSVWPKPTDGFLEFWEELMEGPRRDIDTAVISSGHTSFINKTFALWGVERPDILITDEVVRETEPDTPIIEKLKPAPFAMELALAQWAERQQLPPGCVPAALELAKARRHIVYVGDDTRKDGALAENAGVPFIHLNINNSSEIWLRVSAALHLGRTSIKEASA